MQAIPWDTEGCRKYLRFGELKMGQLKEVEKEPDLNDEDEKAVAAMEYLKTYCKRQWCDTCGLGDKEFCWLRDCGCLQG